MTGVVNISLAFVLRRPADVPGFIYALRYTAHLPLSHFPLPSSHASRIFIANAAQLSVKKSRVLPAFVDSRTPVFASPFDTLFDVFKFSTCVASARVWKKLEDSNKIYDTNNICELRGMTILYFFLFLNKNHVLISVICM